MCTGREQKCGWGSLKPKNKSGERSIEVSLQHPQGNHLTGSESRQIISETNAGASVSVNNWFPFVLLWVEAAGEARLRIWLLTLKPLEDSQVCSSSSEKKLGSREA